MADRATTRIRNQIDGVGAITITSQTRNKAIDTPFMLPYAPQNGLDPWIMLPANYGYSTTNGYLERTKIVTCSVEVVSDKMARSVESVLHNAGATSVERKRL